MLDYSFALGMSLAALLVCIVNFIYTFIQGRVDKTQNKIFLIILGIITVNSLCNITSALFNPLRMANGDMVLWIEIPRYLYFVTHTALCPMFFYYVSSVSGLSLRPSSSRILVGSIPFVVTELMAITNPFTGWVWSMDENLDFKRNWGEYLIYLAALIYFVSCFIILASTWAVLAEKRKLALVFFFTLVGAGVIVQLLNKNLKIEVLSEAVGFTGVMMAVENEDDRIDFGMGFYNRAALNLDITGCLHNKRHVTMLVIRITNANIVAKQTGTENSGVISDMVSDYLRKIAKRYYIYVANPGTFVLMLYKSVYPDTDQIVKDVTARFENPWMYRGQNIMLNAVLMRAEMPGKLRNTPSIFYMIDSPIPVDMDKKLFEGEDLDYILRRQAVESAVSRGLREKSFEVYYQPTYTIDRKLHGAEALLRMRDRELGNVFPDEFIPVAEQIGLIDAIDDFVLEEVCRFLRTGVPQQFGMDGINVNLSVMQCMQPGFVERINGIVERYGVEKKLINFEITESIAASDYKTLSTVIGQLKKEGFLFSMDDYGTGYSNVSAVFSLNLDVVKIDKSLLWNAEKSELGMIILENTIRMIRQIKKRILVEGVETKEQIELLERLEVDYLQGFYFSKPIPKNALVDLLSVN